MSCRICKRGACTESFHALAEQEKCSCPLGSERDERCALHGKGEEEEAEADEEGRE